MFITAKRKTKMTTYECAICFGEYPDEGYMVDKHICTDCNLKNEVYPEQLHPVTRTPKKFCTCGKPWNFWCRFNAFNDKYGGGKEITNHAMAN